MFILCALIFCCAATRENFNSVFSPLGETPALYKGRLRPLNGASASWFEDLFGSREVNSEAKKVVKEHLRNRKIQANLETPLDFFCLQHFLGIEFFEQTPLFTLKDPELIELLELPAHSEHFSYETLYLRLFEHPSITPKVAKTLIEAAFWEEYYNPKSSNNGKRYTLHDISNQLQLSFRDGKITLQQLPDQLPWSTLNVGESFEATAHHNKELAQKIHHLYDNLKYLASLDPSYHQETLEAFTKLMQQQGMSYGEIHQQLSIQAPLKLQLLRAGQDLSLLPVKAALNNNSPLKAPVEWVSLKALKIQSYNPKLGKWRPSPNFTPYADATFESLRAQYQKLDKLLKKGAEPQELYQGSLLLAKQLKNAYEPYAGSQAVHAKTLGKKQSSATLYLPSTLQLQAENLYESTPWSILCPALYLISFLFYSYTRLATGSFKLEGQKIGLSLWSLAFLAHSLLLISRIYILGRPPVATMFETLIYVPWIMALTSLALTFLSKNTQFLWGANLVQAALIFGAFQIGGDSGLENVQPVLNSQYWLTIHVLMVVGSYAFFLISALLGYFYLWQFWRCQGKNPLGKQLIKNLVFCLYIGTFLLVIGTILGGVWAAQSWGRFWDWDPKESWAFVSSCLYLMILHAWRYQYLDSYLLAIASIFGMSIISFTWYGVNYLLGMGLHSYGFGAGSSLGYLCFFFSQIGLCALALYFRRIARA